MRRLFLVATVAAALSCGGSDERFEPTASDATTETPPSHPDGEIRAFGIDLQKLKPNVSQSAVFGHAISIEGDTLAVGAMIEGGSNIGRVYVFVRAGAAWVLQQKLQASDPTAGVRFGKSVDLSGNTLIVGAAGEAGNPQVGAAYVFVRTGSTWTEQQKIVAPDGQAQDRFGQVVRIDGDTAVIGAVGDDDKGSDAGSTYIFVRSGTTWSQQQKITAADGAPGDQFGYGVAIAGDTVAIGARRDDTAAVTDHGSVYVFVRSGTTWSQQQKIVAADAAFDDNFGRSVALFNQTLLVGAMQRSSGGNGAAYVFTRSGVTWSLQQKLTASDGQGGDLFGADVALFGDVAAISQRFDDDTASNAGAVYVFTRAGVTWTQAQKLRPADGQTEDRFGQAVDVHGTTLVGGSAGDDDLANNSGAAYVFESPVVVNGSFETANYTGWTLSENSGQQQFGTFGIATDGQTITAGSGVFDFFNNVTNSVSSPTLPHTYDATDGSFVALQIVGGPEDHRMFQTVAIPPCAAIVRWDMEYRNTFNTFDVNSQFTGVNVRDPATDAVLGSPFRTKVGDPLTVATMSAFEADLSPFAGQTVRLDFEHQVQLNFFDIAWDNIRIQCGTPSAKLAVAPSPFSFGNQPINTTSANQTFTITNQGSANLVVTAITTSAPFAVTPPTLPATILPGGNTTFTGRFSPTATGAASGSISIVSNDPLSPATLNVSGTGTAPAISVNPTSHDFGNQRVGTTSAGKTFAITNTGTATLNVSSITTTGPFATANTSFSIAPGGTQNISGTFSPTATGAASGTIRINHDAAGSPTDIALSGTGIQPAISVSPTLAFGNQRVGTTSTGKTLTISNTGTDALNISSITTTGPFATPNSPLTIAAGGSANISVTFSPAATGSASGTLTITHDAPGSPTGVALSGTGIQPAISVSATLAFGNQRVGTTSTGKTLTISNTGTDTLNISSITTTGPFATPNSPLTIVAGGSANISVTFSPTAAGSASGSLTITHDAPGSPTAVSLSGTGIQPAISVSATLAFGNQRVGTTSTGKTLTISNTGTDTLNISSITTTGPFATPNSPLTIAAGGSANISVTFSPVAPGSASGTLTITHDAPGSPTGVALSGTGIQPAISVNASLAFGDQRVGTTSAGNTLTITNTGTDALNISSIATTGPFATANTPLTIAAGGSANISVTFSPVAPGSASGTLTITHDAPGSPTGVSLSGTGIQPAISIAASVAFGSQRVGTTSAPTTVTVSNTGTDTLNVTAITTTGPFATTNQSFSIAAGGSQNISVTFSPPAPGSASGTLVITHDAPGSPSTSSLSGTGIIPALQVAPSLAFADQRVGTTSAGNTLTISNTGTDTLNIATITTTGPFATANTPLSIAAGSSANIAVTFSPTVPGAAAGTVLFTHDAPGSPTSVALSGTGIEPVISISPSTLSFGNQRVGTSNLKTFDITNLGDDALTITDLSATAPFAVTSATLPITLSPNGSTTVSVTFSPVAAGDVSDVVTITSDAGNGIQTVIVDGRGVEPVISATTSLPFGDVRTNTSANLTVVVTNNGTSDLTLTAANTSPPFSNADGFPVVIAPSASANLTVAFTPTATGGAADNLVILSDASTSPTTVALTGNGVEPLASPDVTLVDFGLQRVGLSSQARTVVLTNPGAFPLTVTSVSASTLFEVTSATAFVVQPNQSATIDIRFTPAAEGLATGTLTVAHDATGSPTTVDLQGTGTVAELDASPATLTFGEIRVGTTSATQRVTVRNLGLAPLSITSITPSAGFVTSGLTVPRNVLPNASVTFDVAFAPGTAGAAAGNIAIATSVGTRNVMLAATAVTAALTADRLQLDLGTVVLGEASGVELVQLTNVTDAPIAIGGATVSDPQFVLDPAPSTASIPPGGSIMFGVRFVPGNGGVAAGQVDVVLAGETAVEVSVQITGQGLIEESGCCSTGGGGASSSLVLGLAVLGLLIPRRRRR